MADRKSFLLRVDRAVLDAVQRWADDDLRSLNGQIEFLLRAALRDAGRAPARNRDSALGNSALGNLALGNGAPDTAYDESPPPPEDRA
jgi:hypothetical protein